MRTFRHTVKQRESCLTFAAGLTSSTTTVARKQEQMSQERELLMHKKNRGRTEVVMEKIQLVYCCYFGFSFRYQKLEGVRKQFQISFIFLFLQSYEIAYLPISESKPHDRHTPSYSSISSLLSCLLQNNPYNYCFFFVLLMSVLALQWEPHFFIVTATLACQMGTLRLMKNMFVRLFCCPLTHIHKLALLSLKTSYWQ